MLLPLKQQAAQEQAQDSKPEPQRVNVACGNSLVLPVEILVQVATYVYIEPLEKDMATHPSILSWEIPWTEEPGGLQFMGLLRVRHGWVTNKHNYRLDLVH